MWRFLNLVDCPYHDYPLLDRCTHCGNSVPLFALPPKIPFCETCKKDLRQCRRLKGIAIDEQRLRLSFEELEFLLSPEECELEEGIPFLLKERLTYKAKLKSMRIIHPAAQGWPREIIMERPGNKKMKNGEMMKRKQDEQSIKRHRATFLNYLNYTRFLGITFNELFDREFFTAKPSDPGERSKQSFLWLEKQWKL